MKKALAIIVCIFISLLIFKKEEVITTFNKIEEDVYTLSFPLNNISTNNFNNYFGDIKVIFIEPNFDNLSYTILNDYKIYQFDNVLSKNNIDNFKNKIVKLLEDNGYRKSAINIRINGIKIKKAQVYCSREQLDNLFSKIEGLQNITN